MGHLSSKDIIGLFERLKLNQNLSFSTSRKDTQVCTHSFHPYPAKFIPQIANWLIKEFTSESDAIWDPFCGSGTTNVEALRLGRRSFGTDINPVAILITKAKTYAFQPEKLTKKVEEIEAILNTDRISYKMPYKLNSRVFYWFSGNQIQKLKKILATILENTSGNYRNFFLCAFSAILKKCSYWSSKSTKPLRQTAKNLPEPINSFMEQVELMKRGNDEFYNSLPAEFRHSLSSMIKIEKGDATKMSISPIDFILTSPPYVTSYEYADLHQLSLLWLNRIKDYNKFRQNFIGTTLRKKVNGKICSKIAEETIQKLGEKDKAKAEEVLTYCKEISRFLLNAFECLKTSGNLCIIIGNTRLRGIEIPNAQIILETSLEIGYTLRTVEMRSIPSKGLPLKRDPITGRFVSSRQKKHVSAYPHEYILVLRK